MMHGDLPETGLQIHSTLAADGMLTVGLADVPVPSPGDDQLVVKVEAAPINPSDLISMLVGANLAEAEFTGAGNQPRVVARLSPEAMRTEAGRVGQPLTVGLEGAGRVVAAGCNAAGLLGKNVAFLTLTRGSFGQYVTVSMAECMPLPDGVSVEQGAGLFCNPMTALAIVETLHQQGHRAMIHTAAASSLGQMLVRICQEDGIGLINIVRRQEQVDLLRAIGATHVCNSSAPTFRDDLLQALRETGAMIAFDAIGGGTMASQLLGAMEAVAAERLSEYSPYGSYERKQVYVYGRLDASPTLIDHSVNGLIWGIESWVMPPILEKAGPERAVELTQRVVQGLTSTFASHYSHEISLPEALGREAMLGYARQATGEKYLIKPFA
jgi:NADPH:quinone reductase-like Zn-dependent oxidoreductase